MAFQLTHLSPGRASWARAARQRPPRGAGIVVGQVEEQRGDTDAPRRRNMLEETLEDLDLDGIGRLLVPTSNDAANA
jgi:hypothetical protein